MTATNSDLPAIDADTTHAARSETYRLDDRITQTSGSVAMTGIQAIIRVPLDQKRIDEQNGLRTAALICGYRGSPVGGMDQAYDADRAILEANDVRFISGVNEDLGATAIWGTQQTALEDSALFDGVTGLWYGKGPGVDRTGDVFRHANTSGVHPNGGVLAVAGDDPACKSSTIASASEWSLSDLAMPTLYPASVQDVLDFGRLGYAMSRASGAWVGLKLHTNVADAYTTVNLDLDRFTLAPATYTVDGSPFQHQQSNTLIAPMSVVLEEEMFGHRLAAAKSFMAEQSQSAHPFDRLIGSVDPNSNRAAKVGIVCAGPVYGELRDALALLGFRTDAHLEEVGIRLYKPAMIWPLEPSRFHTFAEGLEEIIVIEEKRAFIETQIRDLLYRQLSDSGTNRRATNPAVVVGKTDDRGAPMLPSHGGLLTGDLVGPLRERLGAFVPAARFKRERIPLTVLSASASTTTSSPAMQGTEAPSEEPPIQTRTAFFCSGCPHNRSTVLPDGSRGHGGIGCHTMSLNMDREVFGVTHMGGEGAQWVGMAPFVSDDHRFQNLGDGTLAHSGSLAIRQAVSAGTNITYKILFNGTVAMTGGQDAAGEIAVPELTHWLQAEGVAKTIVVADDTKKYPAGSSFAKNSSLVHRDKLDEAQLVLRDVAGTTVLIYDQACAAELRRGRKRGTIKTPTTRVMIDERICEGCGDCGEVSNCASVHPIPTPFGRKTQIHQESCNFDLTCLEGNCPAFVTVEIDPEDSVSKSTPRIEVPKGDMPAHPAIPAEGSVLLVGIGGTGVVTVNQVIATAALLDGKFSNGLDQTGLAQKGGSVVSNLRITTAAEETSNRVGAGQADTILVFDLLTAMKNLDRATAERTRAVISTGLVPTGNMAAGLASEAFPKLERFQSAINAVTHAEENLWLDATGIARQVFASQPAANTLVVGLAYQRGMLPVTGASIERAIELNGVAVQMNLEAFRLGRRLAADAELLEMLDTLQPEAHQRTDAHQVSETNQPMDATASELGTNAAFRSGSVPADVQPVPVPLTNELAGFAGQIGGSENLQQILAWRLPELVAYQDAAYAKSYVTFLVKVRKAEADLVGTQCELSEVVASHLFKLMAYKDEYEVARLALDSDLGSEARRRFGPNARLSYRLEPPTMKVVGLSRKIAIPEAAGRKMFAGLVKAKRARGTRFDPFGRSAERVAERALIGHYQQHILSLLHDLDGDFSQTRYAQAVSIADLADQIRGYDSVKLAAIERYQGQLTTALAAFRDPQIGGSRTTNSTNPEGK